MKIIHDVPPMFDRIYAAFPEAANPGVMFTWGQTLYVPHGGSVSRALMAHEEIHAERQGKTESDIIDWWNRYLVDVGFRLDEELPAHQAEYRAYCKRHGNRTEQGKYLHFVAGRLASPLYGSIVSLAEAKKMVLCV